MAKKPAASATSTKVDEFRTGLSLVKEKELEHAVIARPEDDDMLAVMHRDLGDA